MFGQSRGERSASGKNRGLLDRRLAAQQDKVSLKKQCRSNLGYASSQALREDIAQ